jgi:hypothetical protein
MMKILSVILRNKMKIGNHKFSIISIIYHDINRIRRIIQILTIIISRWSNWDLYSSSLELFWFFCNECTVSMILDYLSYWLNLGVFVHKMETIIVPSLCFVLGRHKASDTQSTINKCYLFDKHIYTCNASGTILRAL